MHVFKRRHITVAGARGAKVRKQTQEVWTKAKKSSESSPGRRRLTTSWVEKVNCPREDRAEAMRAPISRAEVRPGTPAPRPCAPALLPGDGGSAALHTRRGRRRSGPEAPHLGAVCAAAAGSRGNTRAARGWWPLTASRLRPDSRLSSERWARPPAEPGLPDRAGARRLHLPPASPRRSRRPADTADPGGRRQARGPPDLARPPRSVPGAPGSAGEAGGVNEPLVVRRKVHERSGRWEKISHCPPDCESESEKMANTHRTGVYFLLCVGCI